MAEQIVYVTLRGNTVVKQPNDGNVVASVGQKPTITWTAEDEHRIVRISSVVIGDGWPSPQPQPVTPKVWSVLNPNGQKKTYNYVLTVETNAGKILDDPEIENEGQGPGEKEYPPVGGS